MIVEFLEAQSFMTAWVLSPAPHRLGVLGMDGREMNISRNRIINSVELPDPGPKSARLELLRATDASRRVMAEKLDLEELWNILEGEGDEFSFESLASLFYGNTAGVDEKSALARAIFNDGLYFRFTATGAVRHNAAEVESLIAAREQQAEEARHFEDVVVWLEALSKGQVAPEPPEADKTRRQLEDFALWGEKAGHRQQAKKLLSSSGFPPSEEGAFKALILTGDFHPHENIELRRLGIPLVFTPQVEQEVSRLTSLSKTRRDKGRQDLTGLFTMTIDSNGARDLDDAISIKSLAAGRWEVGIHITDVASFVPPESIMDLEARARASSIYLPEGKYPMFPSEMSEGILSLTCGDVKPALSFMAILEEDGHVFEYSVVPSLIRVDRQMSFYEADQTLDENAELVDLWDLSQALMARRLSQGGQQLNIPKLNVFFLADGTLTLGLTQWGTPSKIIIGELMILANYLAADYLHKNGCACPYRYQDNPRVAGPQEERAAEAPDDSDLGLARNLAARRRTGRSGLSFVPAAHSGLGLPVYTAFTAPMRRYLDLLVARQLSSLVLEGHPAMDEQQFLRLGLPAHELTKSINKMQALRQRYWLKVHLADKVGREFTALVFDQRDRRLRICLTDYMFETDIFLPRSQVNPGTSWFGKRLTVKLVPSASNSEGPQFEVAYL